MRQLLWAFVDSQGHIDKWVSPFRVVIQASTDSKLKEIRQFMNTLYYNHPHNMDHKKYYKKVKSCCLLKDPWVLFFKEGNRALCKVLHKGIT